MTVLAALGGGVYEFGQIKLGLHQNEAQLRDMQVQLRESQTRSEAQLREMQAQILPKLDAVPNLYGTVRTVEKVMGVVLNNALPPAKKD